MNHVGKTPLLKLERLTGTGSADIYIKCEGANPTGSMKDRMALSMIEGAERRGGRSVREFVTVYGVLQSFCAISKQVLIKNKYLCR